jgi:RNA polymerase sigma-70 factor (ECF subfamily)
VRAEDDFDAFYAATSGRLVGHAYAMCGSLAEAEDAVQEAFARAWRSWSSVSRYQDPEGWVRTIAFRIAISSWRKAVNRLAAQRRSGRPDDVPGMSPDRVALVAAIQTINPDQRRALVLHYVVGLSVEEISLETGVPQGTVKTRLLRGRSALRELLSETGENTEPVRRV